MAATKIHPTAVIHPDAEIGAGCEIGPYCIIGPKVKLGAGSHLQAHVVLDGNIVIGERAEIYPFACLGKKTQDLKYRGEEGYIRIGANATIREYVTVNMPTGAGLTSIGDNCHLLAYCHIAHDCLVGSHVVMSNLTQLAGHVTVEDRVVFGGMTAVHQFVRIGSMTMVGAHSKVVQDLVPFCLADGNPAQPRGINKVGMNRNGLDEAATRLVSKAHRLLFRSGLTQDQALQEITAKYGESPHINALISFIRQAERGLARPELKKKATDK